jgi:hypothetical protein
VRFSGATSLGVQALIQAMQVVIWPSVRRPSLRLPVLRLAALQLLKIALGNALACLPEHLEHLVNRCSNKPLKTHEKDLFFQMLIPSEHLVNTH